MAVLSSVIQSVSLPVPPAIVCGVATLWKWAFVISNVSLPVPPIRLSVVPVPAITVRLAVIAEPFTVRFPVPVVSSMVSVPPVPNRRWQTRRR